jgi:hypothetical protein
MKTVKLVSNANKGTSYDNKDGRNILILKLTLMKCNGVLLMN